MSEHPHSAATGQQKKLARKRVLNVIYFVDSDKTHSFKLSMGRFRILAVVLGVIFAWSFIGSGFLYYQLVVNADLRSQTRANLATIFRYQSKHDGVYEKAYPNGEPLEPLPSIDVATLTKTKEPQKTEEKDRLVAEEKKPQKLAAKVPPIEKKPLLNIPRPYASIVDTSFVKNNQELQMKFAIKNEISPSKIEGYVWSAAVYKTPDNQDLYVGYPHGISLDSEGRLSGGRSASKYSIRRFKVIEVNFPSPNETVGKFSEVRVFVKDFEGNEKKFSFPVDVDVGIEPPAPVEPPPPISESSSIQTTPSTGGFAVQENGGT